jgi:hypothetical protein
MRHQKPELRPRRRAPAVNARDRARPFQPDPGLTSGLVGVTVFREPRLMRAPAQLRRLEPFRDEPLHRPRIHEDPARTGQAPRLGVALGDMDALTPSDCIRRAQPSRSCGTSTDRPRSSRERQKRLLHEPRHHAGIGPAARHRRRPARVARLLVAHRLPERVVRPRRVVGRAEIVSGPWLHDRVDVGNADLAAEFHQVERGRIHAQVHTKPLARLQKAAQHLAVILGRQLHRNVVQPVLPQKRRLRLVGFDDRQPVRRRNRSAARSAARSPSRWNRSR